MDSATFLMKLTNV
jgi:DNA repair exonuclease SbcCD ATPase subunit